MIDKVRTQAEQVDWKDYDSIIEFYEKNQFYFDNINIISNNQTIEDFFYIKEHYINALISKKRYTKAHSFVTHLNILTEKVKDDKILYDKYIERYEFLNGIILGYSKKYSEALDSFKQLRKIDPDNDLYKTWHSSLRTNLLYNQVKYIGLIGLAILVINMFGDMAFGFKLNKNITIVALILMIGSWVFPYIAKFIENLKTKQ